MKLGLSVYDSWDAHGFRSVGKHDEFTEVEVKVNFNSMVSSEIECR